METQQIVLGTVQHSKLLDIDEVEPINQTDYDVLESIRKILVDNNYTDRFGVTLLHKHFDLEEDEILMEDTDVEARTSVVRVEKASETEGKIIETMWKFNGGVHNVTVCVRRCNYNSGHKNVHVREAR